MREIKFRAWNKKYKEMWNVTSMSWVVDHDYQEPEREISNKIQSIGSGNKDSWNPIGNDIVLMQYTGLKDKNGIEVYEGDVLLSDESEWWQENGIEPIVVEDIACLPTQQGDWSIYIDDYEVIGNIYENPELLK